MDLGQGWESGSGGSWEWSLDLEIRIWGSHRGKWVWDVIPGSGAGIWVRGPSWILGWFRSRFLTGADPRDGIPTGSGTPRGASVSPSPLRELKNPRNFNEQSPPRAAPTAHPTAFPDFGESRDVLTSFPPIPGNSQPPPGAHPEVSKADPKFPPRSGICRLVGQSLRFLGLIPRGSLPTSAIP